MTQRSLTEVMAALVQLNAAGAYEPLLDATQIVTLTQLRYGSGEYILTREDPEIIQEVAALIMRVGFPTAVEQIRSSPDRERLLFETPLLKEAQERALIDSEILRNKVEVTNGLQCPRCKSQNTLTTQKQIRSADEPMTTISRCLACAKVWRF